MWLDTLVVAINNLTWVRGTMPNTDLGRACAVYTSVREAYIDGDIQSKQVSMLSSTESRKETGSSILEALIRHLCLNI
jgi:hypothetical protein